MYDVKRWGDPLTQFAENMTQPRLTPSHYVFFSLFLRISLAFSRPQPATSRILPSQPIFRLSLRPCPYLFTCSVTLNVCASLFLLSHSSSLLRPVSFPLSRYLVLSRSFSFLPLLSLFISLFFCLCLTRIAFALSADQANYTTRFFL